MMTFEMGRGLTNDEPPTGTYGQISMARLIDELRRSGEIKANERVTHIVVEQNGLLRYRVERA